MVRPTPASIKQPISDEEHFDSGGNDETATDKELGGESQSGWQTDRYMTSRGTDRQTKRQTDRQIDRQTDGQTDGRKD